jgi:transcriptional regulator with XRE-family HTH domain
MPGRFGAALTEQVFISDPRAVQEVRKPRKNGTGPVEEEIIEHKIARCIRQLRSDRGLTLKQVSDVTGLSKGLLSKIENCIVSPPIGTLCKIAGALEVPIAQFFDMDGLDAGAVFFPKSKRKTVVGRRTYLNYEYQLLVHGRGTREMNPMIVLINGKNYKFGLQEHPGEQFIFVLDGSMDYVVGDRSYSLEPEDCIYHDARLPHGPKLSHNQKVRYLVVHSGS